MPRLAAQREDYLLKALRDYKSAQRPGLRRHDGRGDPPDHRGRHRGPLALSRAAALKRFSPFSRAGLEEFSQTSRPHFFAHEMFPRRTPFAPRIRAMTICPGQTRDTFVWLCDDCALKAVNNPGRTS